jgi:hypothetical protein
MRAIWGGYVKMLKEEASCNDPKSRVNAIRTLGRMSAAEILDFLCEIQKSEKRNDYNTSFVINEINIAIDNLKKALRAQ